MPRVVTFLLLFVPALFVGDRILGELCAWLVSKSNDRYVEVYEGRAKAEVLVIGNSRADNHFPPQMMSALLGERVVNLGLGGVSGMLAEVLLVDYVENNDPPKLLVTRAELFADRSEPDRGHAAVLPILAAHCGARSPLHAKILPHGAGLSPVQLQ